MAEFAPSDISIVIPTHRRRETLELTLSALQAQTVRGFETIVVVDGPDGAPGEADEVKVLTQDHAGPGVARNRGVAATDRALVIFIGDDMIPRPDFVGRHLDRHRSEPGDEVA